MSTPHEQRLRTIGLCQKRTNSTTVVHLYFVRHALSCTNAVDIVEERWFARFLRLFDRDPPLANRGIADSQRSAECFDGFDDFDLVLTSFLRRAIETAHHMFPRVQRIVPVPYVRELGFWAANVPLSIEEQRRYFEQNDVTLARKVDWSVRERYERGALAVDDRTNALCENIFQTLERHLLPDLTAAKDEVHVIIVTHSHYLQACFPSIYYENGPNNNSVLRTTRLWNGKRLQPSAHHIDRVVSAGKTQPKTLRSDEIKRCHT